ncbi:MAG: hypothetical protein QNJ20_03130 [Paracoccaceae bacterium]|nr:hypothetical protein [Paracoccaceae bacterium]
MRTVLRLGPITTFAVLLAGASDADVMQATRNAKAGEFVATGEVACAQEVGEELGTCLAKVARDDTDAAAVVVTFPNGFSRTLTFEGGAFLRGNTTMSGVGTDTEWTLEDGRYRVRVDDQRFEIPQALVAED